MRTMEVWPEPVEQGGDFLTMAATLEWPDTKDRFRLWYRLPGLLYSRLTRSAEPLLLGSLFSAMRTSSRLVVHGEVSPSLLKNLVEFQMAWTRWKPELYRMVDIAVDKEQEQEPASTTGTVMVFSGGADSAFSAWRHHREEVGRERCDLRAGVLVHGFDIPLSDESGYAGAADKAGQMLASLGMDLLRMATNFRELKDDWEDAHGAGLLSCLSLLQGHYRAGLIASSYPYEMLSFPCGSNPLTDGMLSSGAFPIIHDGAGYNRFEKLQSLVQWPEAMQHMRVCWQGVPRDRNCCRCQKCVSNMIYLRILGKAGPPCFPLDISDREITWLHCQDQAMIVSMQRLLTRAREQQRNDSWVRALERCILINRLRLNRMTGWMFRSGTQI